MCGIAGILLFDDSYSESAGKAVSVMLESIAHRGPDSANMWASDHIVLGHRRLSIIDLETGDQPIFNEDKSCVIVYNGETYNFSTIHEQLAPSYNFQTRSDTEVLLHQYEEKGPEFSDDLEGMFCYSIWDAQKQTLNIGVDAFGIKPLYYYHSDRCFLFCSEIRGIIKGMKAIGIEPTLNVDSTWTFLRNGWFPAPQTGIQGVKKFLPGQRLSLNLNNMLVFDTPLTIPNYTTLDAPANEQPLDQLDQILCDSVKEQLIADVPVGILLSGGIDSSLVSHYAAAKQPDIHTFSVGFSGDSDEARRSDETAFARSVAESMGTTHHEFRVNPDVLRNKIDTAIEAMDEPIADPAILPLLTITELASRHVKVVLCGDGGDELFAGYNRAIISPYKNIYHRLPTWLHGLFRLVFKLLPESPGSQSRWKELLRKVRVVFDIIDNRDYNIGPFSGRQLHWINFPGADDKTALLQYPASQADIDTFELQGQMAGQMLAKTDRISMWNSIEVRVPFLNKRVASFARNLERNHKVKGKTTKLILRQLISKFVPSVISERPKQGFRMPLSGWMKNELREYLETSLLQKNALLDKFMSREQTRALLDEHLSGKAEHTIRIWTLLVLSKWVEMNEIKLEN